MDTYNEKLAPIFSQIVLQKASKNYRILRELCERLQTFPDVRAEQMPERFAFERAAKEFKELWSAYGRIRDKCYGRCIECGADIDLLRLNLSPETSHCLNCGQKLERRVALPRMNALVGRKAYMPDGLRRWAQSELVSDANQARCSG